MFTNERQNKIMDFLKEHKTAYVRELAHSLYASEATIRRDLAELKKWG